MKIERTGTTLTIKETPGCLWIFGLFFAAIGGIFLYISLSEYMNNSLFSLWVLAVGFFVGICSIGASFLFIYDAAMTKTVIDRNAETLTYREKSLFGRRRRVFTFNEIDRFVVFDDCDDDGEPLYSLGFNLASGETIRISANATPDAAFNRDIVFQANELLYKQMPSYRHAAELEDET